MSPWEESTEALGRHSRSLLSSITDNPTFKWAMVAVGCTVGALLLIAIIVVIWLACKRRRDTNSRVAPSNGMMTNDMERGVMDQKNMAMAPLPPPAMLPPGVPVGDMYGAPVPPWEQYGLPPPGIMLSPSVPVNFMPYTSNPRPPNAPAYERLILISSRVHQPVKVAEAALPNAAVVVYDWKTFTLQELLRHIKKALGPAGKVTSVAVVAPGNKPGSVALLEGCSTSADKLSGPASSSELAQFWRVLSGCVAPNGVADGRRVDLLGCRVVEAPRDGAALLRELWRLTAVPFAAADDALGGYQLSTFMEEPTTGACSIITSTIRGIDIYFDRTKLLGIEPPGAVPSDAGLLPPLPSTAYAAPLPPGPPPVSALVPVAPQAAAPAPGGLPPTPVKDIFARFTTAAAAQQLSLNAVFTKYDTAKKGWLGQDQVLAMVKEMVPSASDLDCSHFRAMLDLDGNTQVTLAEFLQCLDSNKAAAAAVRTGRDDSALMECLHTYLTDNEQIIANYFNEADVNKSGTLDHTEICALVAQIPGLVADEQRFISSYLYQVDTTGKGQLTFEQLKAAVKAYGTPQAKAAVASPPPTAVAAPPARPAAAPVPTSAPVAAAAPVAPTPLAAAQPTPAAPKPGPALAPLAPATPLAPVAMPQPATSAAAAPLAPATTPLAPVTAPPAPAATPLAPVTAPPAPAATPLAPVTASLAPATKPPAPAATPLATGMQPAAGGIVPAAGSALK